MKREVVVGGGEHFSVKSFLLSAHFPGCQSIVSFFLFGILILQEAMMKDTLERTREPNLNLKDYLQNAYIHPVFKGADNDDDDSDVASEGWNREPALVPTKRVSRRTTPLPSKHGGSSPPLLSDVEGFSGP